MTHDADDHGWQFIGSSDTSVKDERVVCLEHIVELDPSVLAVADLSTGWHAVRKRRGARWIRRTSPLDPDDET